jgi:hypothetical protein
MLAKTLVQRQFFMNDSDGAGVKRLAPKEKS